MPRHALIYTYVFLVILPLFLRSQEHNHNHNGKEKILFFIDFFNQLKIVIIYFFQMKMPIPFLTIK